MKIHLLYFAQLRECAGNNMETLDTDSTQPGELYAELAAAYHFPLSADEVRVAINNEFCAMSQPLQDGDEVAFIPPVSGG